MRGCPSTRLREARWQNSDDTCMVVRALYHDDIFTAMAAPDDASRDIR